MILYKEDWYNQDAIPHTTTDNKSFLKMVHTLKSLGVDNHAFFLALHDKDLEHIKPHELKDPSPELATKIAIECKKNPWYFLREIARLPASGLDPVPIELNLANLTLFWCFYNTANIFLIQPRQTGKTINVSTLCSHLTYFLYKKSGIFLYTHSNDLVQDNVERIKLIRDGLPKYLVLPSRDDTENKTELYYNSLENHIYTKTAQKSISAAFNVGRGKTFVTDIIDEGPFCSNIQISYPVFRNASNKAREIARQNDIPHGTILITTAGVLDTKEGAYVYDILNKACFFTPKLFDLNNNDELKYIIKKNSKNNFIYAEYSHKQLGYDDDWVNAVARENNLTEDQIKRDLLNQWTSGTNAPVVPADILEKLDMHKEHPVYTDTLDGYVFKWYEHPQEVFRSNDRYFVMGLDTSENVGNDFTTIHLMDVKDLSTIMTSRCNDEDLLKLAVFIAKFLIEHPTVTFIPESRSTATVLINVIIKELIANGINPFTRIFNKVVQMRNDPLYATIDISNGRLADGPYRKYFGYKTSATGEMSRDALYKLTLRKVLTLAYDKIRDINLIQEIHTLTIRNGRIDHAISGHDDQVVSLMMASWLLFYGKNLSVYGIPQDIVLSLASKDAAKIDVTMKQRLRDLRSRLERLKSQIEYTTNPTVKFSLETEYRNIEEEISRKFANVPEDVSNIDKHSTSTRKGLSNNDLYNIFGIQQNMWMI